MTSNRWSQIAEIARAALARDQDVRDAFLRTACGNDPALRREVEAAMAKDDADTASATFTASARTGGDPPRRDTGDADIAHIESLLAAAGNPSPYRVVSRVGSGGMGVVYKALDTRLNRAVALKVIRRGRELDTGRLRKEALAAASLDHPYICKVYELIDTKAEQVIVMEFVEGETLSRRLRQGIPPLDTTLQLAIEIGEGLANAHERGLVHRDLKPSNVMVTRYGHIKLLDFGLARPDATRPASADTQATTQSTDARAGTPFYMAPEQAAGHRVTARADVFALGVVLFECLTGRRPFDGVGQHDYLHHLRVDPPKALRDVAPDAPAALADLIDRCLNKTPAHRPESARQVVQELRRIAAMLGASAETAAVRSRRRTRRWFLVAAVTALAVIGAFAWRSARHSVANAPDWRSRPFVTSSRMDSGSRISPDGQWISYLSGLGGDTQLLVGRVDGGTAQRVALPAGSVMDQLWSPDGSRLAYLLRQGPSVTLQVVPAFFGGTPARSAAIVPAPTAARLLRWIDRVVYVEVTRPQGRSLQRVDIDSGQSVDITSGWTIPGMLWGFDVSHDGRRVVFTQRADGQEELWTADLDGTSARRLTTNAFFERYPLWSGQGASIFYQSNRGGQIDIWQMSLASGSAWPLTSGQAIERPESASSDDTLVSFVQVSEDADLWVWHPSTGARQLTGDALSDFAPTAADTGSSVVFQRMRPTPTGQAPSDFTLFAGALSDSGFQPPPQPVDDGYVPRLSPDGSWLAYLRRGPGSGATLFVKHLQTNRTIPLSPACPRPVYSTFPLDWAEQNIAWNRSGTELYFVDGTEKTTLRRYRTGAVEAERPLATVEPGTSIRDLYPSPDGRTVAYVASGGKASALHLLETATGSVRSMLDLQGAAYVRGWLPGNGGLVLVRAVEAHDDLSADVEVLVVSPAGVLRSVGRIDRAFLATVRLDPGRALLYATRSEGGVHNLYTFALNAQEIRRLTDNTLPGVTFSGLDSLGAAGIIGVRTERKSDIWLLDAAAGLRAGAGQSGR
jgi:serine/threonine protein kinase